MIEIKYELPFNGVNTDLLRERVVDEFSGLSTSDLDVVVHDTYVIGLRADVDASSVTQSAINTATQSVNSALGATVVVVDWGEPPL